MDEITETTPLETMRKKVEEYEKDGQDYIFRMNSNGRWEISTLAEGLVVDSGHL